MFPLHNYVQSKNVYRAKGQNSVGTTIQKRKIGTEGKNTDVHHKKWFVSTINTQTTPFSIEKIAKS